jgi:hypothetical protein
MSSVMKVFRQRQRAPRVRGVSRRALVGGACLAVTSATAGAVLAEPGKASQKDAGYQTSPKGDARCEKCMQFLPPSSCKLVAGQISPSGWCTFFAPKAT